MAKITLFIICTLLSVLGESAPAQAPKYIVSPIIHSTGNRDFFIPFMNLSVGTPPQPVTVLLDTGSSDLVIPQTASSICWDPQQQCSGTPFMTGSVDPNKSKDLQPLDQPFNATFANGVDLIGSFVKTSLTIGDKSTPNLQVGLITEGSLPPGSPLFPIFGIGPLDNEAVDQLYPNIPSGLKDAGAVQSNVYSIYMNDFRNPNAHIIFGGVDTAKFSGELVSSPILANDLGLKPSFVIDFSSIGMNGGDSGDSGLDLTPKDGLPPVLIDSGNPGIDIPIPAIRKLAKALNIDFDERLGLSNVPCSLGSNGESLSFGFANDKSIINVPMDALLVRDSSQGETQCFLPINPSDDIASIGAPFMQGAMVVFDLDQEKLWTAQAKINATKSNIQDWKQYQGGQRRD